MRRLIEWIRRLFKKSKPKPKPKPVPPKPPVKKDIKGSFGSYWNFAPAEYDGKLFLPLSIGVNGPPCTMKKFTSAGWINDKTNIDAEDVTKLIPFKGDLFIFAETNQGIWRRDKKGVWRMSYKFAGKGHGEYGCFDAVVLGKHIFTTVSGYDPGRAVKLLKYVGKDQWHKFTICQDPNGRATAWATGTDGKYIFIGIAGFARGTQSKTTCDGIWRVNPKNMVCVKESFIQAQAFCQKGDKIYAGDNEGIIWKRENGKWIRTTTTSARFVISLLNHNGNIYAGTEDPPVIYKNGQLLKQLSVSACPVYLGEYQGDVVYAYHAYGKTRVDRL